MMRAKTLAFERVGCEIKNERPYNGKNTIYTGTVLLSFIASCSGALPASAAVMNERSIPRIELRGDETSHIRQWSPQESGMERQLLVEAPPTQLAESGRVCRASDGVIEYTGTDGEVVRREDVLRHEETVLGTACFDNIIFTLITYREQDGTARTDLMKVFLSPNQITEDGAVSLSYVRADVSEIIEPGLVTWTASPQAAYFLTLDGMTTVVPAQSDDGRAPRYAIDSDVNGARMISFSGFLFVVTSSGDMVVRTFSENGMSATRRDIHLPANVFQEGAHFFLSQDALYFGNENGQKVEIRIDGPTVDGISVPIH